MTCEAVGCRASILSSELFCARHYAMLESDIRRVLGKLFRPGKRASRALELALAQARCEILYVVTNGHNFPKDRSFQWDDGEPEVRR